MEFYLEEACGGIELLDMLFDKNDGILCHENMIYQNDQPWPMQDTNMMMPDQGSKVFFNALLNGNDSVSDSPLWPPSPSDSGISEDPHSYQNDSPPPPGSPPLGHCYVPPHVHYSPAPNTAITIKPVSSDGWESGISLEMGDEFQNGCKVPPAQLATSFPLTIKDLLLSGASEPHPPASQLFCQDLILNEDEKKLLVKEGVNLPSQLPLTKYEERILKKIRRKIRNKQSAQESRKKKKEYVDGLESRMAACSAENQVLQRKVFQLEKCNISLMEQLRRLQAMVMNRSNKPAQTGTCVLVLMLSFTLILLPSLKPFTDTKVIQPGDFSPLRVQMRSLHSLQSARVMHALERPYSVTEESKSVLGYSDDENIKEITPLMEKLHEGAEFPSYNLGSSNTSLDPYDDRFHGDPITGDTATITLRSQRGARLQPHADDM